MQVSHRIESDDLIHGCNPGIASDRHYGPIWERLDAHSPEYVRRNGKWALCGRHGPIAHGDGEVIKLGGAVTVEEESGRRYLELSVAVGSEAVTIGLDGERQHLDVVLPQPAISVSIQARVDQKGLSAFHPPRAPD